MQEYHYLIPHQQQGAEKDIAHAITCETTEDAEDCFVDAKERLLDVNNWNKYGAINGLEFRLKDSRGKETIRHARKGGYIKIALPGHNSLGAGEGSDWVAIEAVEYDDYPDQDMETFAMRLHPSINPINKREGDVAYSLTDDATSTFVIERLGKKLVATYHGRNEAEYQQANATGDPAWLDLSDIQWAGLVKGIAESGMVRR